MGLKLSSLKYDTELAENGVWVPVGDGARIKVAKSGNRKHRQLVQQLRRPYRSYELAGKDLPEDIQRDIAVKATASTILLGWEGIQDDKGKDIPFTPENVKEALMVDGFMSMVLGFANDEATFKAVTKDDEVKNSSKSSSGSSNEGAAG